MLLMESKKFLSRNQMGWRLLALILLIPFIYAILFFAGSQTLWTQSAPPIYSSVSSHKRDWNRLLALRDVLYRKIALHTSIDPVPMGNHGAIKEHLRSHYAPDAARSAASLLRILAKLTDDPHSFTGNLTPSKVESICDNIEELIRALERS